MGAITLPNARACSDITFKVRLKDNDVAVDWNSLSDIRALIYSDVQRAVAGRCTVSIDGEDSTLLVCNYSASKPQYLGINSIVIRATYQGRTKTYDKKAVNIVARTAQLGAQVTINDPTVNVQIEVTEVDTSLLDDAINAAFDAAEDAIAARDLTLATEADVEAAEALRVTAEQGRVDAEALRVSAESGRVAAEALRVSAESGRVNAENAREIAEGRRVSTMETCVRQEKERADAEELRVAAEQDRVDAESIRVANEEGREEDEEIRIGAESERIEAESARVDAESARVDAEALRVSAESDRVDAETARAAQASDDHDQYVEDHAVVAGYNTRLASVEGEVSQLSAEVDELEDGYIVPPYTLIDGGITTSGSVGSGTTYKHTSAIPVLKGQTVKVSTAGYAFALISKDENGTYTPQLNITTGDANVPATYIWTAPSDMSISVTIKSTVQYSIGVESAFLKRIAILENRADELGQRIEGADFRIEIENGRAWDNVNGLVDVQSSSYNRSKYYFKYIANHALTGASAYLAYFFDSDKNYLESKLNSYKPSVGVNPTYVAFNFPTAVDTTAIYYNDIASQGDISRIEVELKKRRLATNAENYPLANTNTIHTFDAYLPAILGLYVKGYTQGVVYRLRSLRKRVEQNGVLYSEIELAFDQEAHYLFSDQTGAQLTGIKVYDNEYGTVVIDWDKIADGEGASTAISSSPILSDSVQYSDNTFALKVCYDILNNVGAIDGVQLGDIVCPNVGQKAVVPQATTATPGYMSVSDKEKLDSIPFGGGDITIQGSGVAKNASSFGFLPTNTADANVSALQNALSGGGTILVDLPGVYKLDSTIYVDSNTTIIFGAGVYIKKATASNNTRARYVFVNRGALTKSYDENISIYGLQIIPDGAWTGSYDIDRIYAGARGLCCFYFVKNLLIDGYKVIDYAYNDYGLLVCTFENATLRNIHLEIGKDGVHFGKGRRFVLQHCTFLTNDDPIALNAVDYPNSNIEPGWIEDGIIEDITLLYASSELSFNQNRGMLLLVGSWKEWENGYTYKTAGDYCLSNGRVYQTNGATGTDSSNFVISTNQPTHSEGTVTYPDGLIWTVKSDDAILNAGIRNIHFKDLYIYRHLSNTVVINSEYGGYMRGTYPGSIQAVIENVTFEGLQNLCPDSYGSGNMFRIQTPITNFRIKDCYLDKLQGSLFNIAPVDDVSMATPLNISMVGNYYNKYAYFIYNEVSPSPSVVLSISGSMKGANFTKNNRDITPTFLSTDI